MELLSDHPAFDLYDPSWVIHTRSEERPPAHVRSAAQITSSLISHGCIIKGRLSAVSSHRVSLSRRARLCEFHRAL